MGDKIVVVGSMNMDLVVKADRYPEEGETIFGESFNQIPGGKGANQAVAIGKLGGRVSFISACGSDQYGDILLSNLAQNGVDTESVFRVKENTGIALITINSRGDNRIIVVKGANGNLSPELVDKVDDRIKESDILVLQMEIPLETVVHSIEIARSYGTKVILDPAPALPLPESVLDKIDYLLPNEGELKQLLPDNKYEDDEDRVKKLLETGVGTIILTRGEEGVSLYSKSSKKDYKAIKVDAVDTTAAGDAFAGAFAYGLSQRWNEDRAISFAIKAAGLSVTRLGAQSSLPDLSEVLNF